MYCTNLVPAPCVHFYSAPSEYLCLYMPSDTVCTTFWPLVQAALQQMKPGSSVRLHAPIPFLGHDPTGMVPRCPVEIHIKAAVKQPNSVAAAAKIFTPTLSSQRHALALQVLQPAHAVP